MSIFSTTSTAQQTTTNTFVFFLEGGLEKPEKSETREKVSGKLHFS